MMNEEIVEALEGEILNEFEALKKMPAGGDEQKAVVDNIVKLYKMGTEEGKLAVDYEESKERLEMERKQAELDEELKVKQYKKDRLVSFLKLGIDACGIVFPLMFYASWMKRGFKFEQEGTFTSTTFRNLFNKFKPTK